MTSHQQHLLGLALSLSMCSALAASPADGQQSARFAQALADYEDGHWPQAFEALARLADERHAEAARIAALMARHQRDLYGQAFAVTPERLAAWLDLAAQGARAGAP